MTTQAGKVSIFKNVHLVVFPGFRFDAFDDGGISIAWQGPTNLVKVGPDGIPVFVGTDNANALLTINLLQSSNGIDFMDAWISLGVPKILTLRDASGTTFLTEPTAMPEQRADMTYNASDNPLVYNIICPRFRGPIGSLNNPG